MWSNEPAHEPIITTRLIEEAQKARRERSLRHGGRPELDTTYRQPPLHPARQDPVRASGRRMQPAVIRDNVY
ncbi:hypothetical protein [Streptomyces sp. NPDC002640]